MEENQLSSAMFLQRLSDKNDFEQWLLKNSSNFDEQKKESLKLCAEYLLYMDSKVHHLMTKDDIKLSFFCSSKLEEFFKSHCSKSFLSESR